MARPAALKARHYYILVALGAGDRHGLAIAREVERLSEGQVRLWPASLYSSLEDLLARGLIVEVDDPRERPPDESERKRFFRITSAGRRAMAEETERLAGLVRIARARARTRPGETG